MAPQKEFLSQKNHCTQEGGDAIEMELEEKRREKDEREGEERRRQDRTRESKTELQHTAHPSVEQVSGQV